MVGYAAIAGDADYHAFLYDATATLPMQDFNLFCFCEAHSSGGEPSS